MPTDLPEPVVPAINRCGMRARSAMTGSPQISLPRVSASRPACVFIGRHSRAIRAGRRSRPCRLGSSMPITVRPGHDRDAHRDRAHRAGDVVGEADHARRLDAGRRFQLVEGDDRARGAPARSGRARRNPRAPPRACGRSSSSASSSTACGVGRRRLGQQVERRQDRLARRIAGRAPADVPARRGGSGRVGARRGARHDETHQAVGNRRRCAFGFGFGLPGGQRPGGTEAAARGGRDAAASRRRAAAARYGPDPFRWAARRAPCRAGATAVRGSALPARRGAVRATSAPCCRRTSPP